jgi:hypothetical protein
MPDQPTPHESIPNTYRDVGFEVAPPGHSIAEATFAELRAAGFHGRPEAEPIEREPGTAPLDELLIPGEEGLVSASTLLGDATFHVLRDSEETIVATWDEGRWWTPEESDAFTVAIEAEFDGEEDRRAPS